MRWNSVHVELDYIAYQPDSDCSNLRIYYNYNTFYKTQLRSWCAGSFAYKHQLVII